jgi:hypothetical protein
MTIAFQQLCQLCSPNTSRKDIENVSFDWQGIWGLALHHRVTPVLVNRIKHLELSPPREIKKCMQKHIHENTLKGMEQVRELISLTDLFEKNNINFVVFKGIALIKTLGLELHHRHHGDIDVLLADINDLWFVDELLVREGYIRHQPQKKIKLNNAQKRHFLNHEKDFTYIHKKKKINLEVHFKLFKNLSVDTLSSKKVWKKRCFIYLTGKKIPVMNRADMQLYLLLHGAISRWFRLKWLCDLSIISHNSDEYAQLAFIDEVKESGLDRMVSQGLWLMHTQFQLPIHNYFLKKYKTDRKLRSIIKKAQASQLTTTPLPKSEDHLLSSIKEQLDKLSYHWNLTDSLLPKVRLFNNAMTNIRDWELLPLPSLLFFLYYPIKPMLWLYRKIYG